MQLFLLCFILAMTVESLVPSDGLIEWVWMGGLSPASISFRVGLKQDLPFDYTEMINDIYLKVHSLTNPKAHKMNFATSEQSTKDVIIFDVVGLFEGHDFEYSIHLGRNILKTGTFQTPSTAPLDFTIAFSSCMDQQSDPKVFETIASHKPLLFFHLGDLHYDNIAQDDEELFKNGYLSTFRSPSGKAMLDMNIPTVYMWDDHDFGPDNSDSMAPGRRAAIKTYKEFVPHYELDRSKANVQDDEKRTGGSVHQSFQIGTVLFILTDLRSQRTPNSASDSSNKTVLGPHQKQMFKDLILKSLEASSTVQCIVWCNTMPWVDDERKWGHFKTEQQELVDFFNQHQVLKHKRFFIISGDAHMIAVDDGTNSPGNIPVFHSAALGREGSVKGGPYSHGAFPGSGILRCDGCVY